MKILYTDDITSPIYSDAVAIRKTVFVEEQGVPLSLEIDENEAVCIHFVLYDEHNQATATCRILPEPGREKVILQRMAVLEAHRGRQLGKVLLEAAIDFAKQQNYLLIELHAQISARGFYEKMGFEPFGEVFEEAGITHVHMRMAL
ncbi:MAG: GNAT family N-acetyltransferase [Neisseria sp.]|uniref:GNAT family N-acetyltransferase n=1 Tax=Neisseria sp. TaxID=192066 RepID=UPI0026DD4198|nr:GNAT family N-acetyltransferase [Neisseria sp.]MDO4640268.1 GNAT family N-acetyltransferase [Neisseria sp.]